MFLHRLLLYGSGLQLSMIAFSVGGNGIAEDEKWALNPGQLDFGHQLVNPVPALMQTRFRAPLITRLFGQIMSRVTFNPC